MYKVRKIKFIDHPVLKNMEFDFTGKDGKAVDTVIVAGENGCGKSTLLNELYKVVSGQSPESNVIEYEIDDEIYIVEVIRESSNSWRSSYYNVQGKKIHVDIPAFGAIYSDVDINFNSKSISTVTSMSLDEEHRARRSDSNLPTMINQLLVDIQALDDADISKMLRDNPTKTYAELNIDERMNRFKKAFSRMFENLEYNGITNQNGRKVVFFKKNNDLIPIESLSSGEKQIVYRGCFLLRDINASKGAFAFIDEPEISLHPSWQTKIMDYYKNIFTNEAREQTSQMFVVTHSPFIIHNQNRQNDKVIVLNRNVSGEIQIKNKAEYYKCSSEELIQDAFSIDFYKDGEQTVYLEGRTDEMYFSRAVEVYKLDIPFSFKWVGYLKENGQEENTGKDALNKAYQFLVGRNLVIKNVCLFDCDTSRVESKKNNVYIRTLHTYENSKNMKKGIENALVLDSISMDDFYTKKERKGDYGDVNIITEFEKMRFCEHICSLTDEELVPIFVNLKKEIERISQIFV